MRGASQVDAVAKRRGLPEQDGDTNEKVRGQMSEQPDPRREHGTMQIEGRLWRYEVSWRRVSIEGRCGWAVLAYRPDDKWNVHIPVYGPGHSPDHGPDQETIRNALLLGHELELEAPDHVDWTDGQ